MDQTAVAEYYDLHVVAKIRDFVDGNRRVEAAWSTLGKWAPERPRRIVELGCGLGNVAWRMARRWPQAQVLGLDQSPLSIEYASKLFRLPNLSFSLSSLDEVSSQADVDLVVLMDVYEHISRTDRGPVHAWFKRALAPAGRLIVTVPTADYNHWIAVHSPELLQPVDEEIDVRTLLSLAEDCGRQLLLFQEVNVWKESDYAHAVIGNRRIGQAFTPPSASAESRSHKLMKTLFRRKEDFSRDERKAMVRKLLGPDAYSG